LWRRQSIDTQRGGANLSDTVEIHTEVRDPQAAASACRRLGLPEPRLGTTSLFEGEAAGLVVQLPGWHYPVVIKTETGEVLFDNFEGRWGDRAHLDRFLQTYLVEKTAVQARKQGFTVTEQVLSDGSISVDIQVGGAE
jgi:hypothetical protein